MENYKILVHVSVVLSFICLAQASIYSVRTTAADLMKCSYGERGSLTATCINATASYFKQTPYRFDQLDETVRCINCSLETLEAATFDLSGNHIQYLDLRNSQIKTIRSKAFVGLIFMEDLNMANNSITSIYPLTFMGVKKVNNLDLSNNLITSLSDNAFFELINLKKLHLNNNVIQFLANNTFHGLTLLEVLDLSNNKLNNINVFNPYLSNLKMLNIRNNQISNLSGNEFINLTSLISLDLSWNKIRVPPITIDVEKGGNALFKLDLSHNMIDYLRPNIFGTLNNLEDLDLSYNQIHTIPQKTLLSLHKLVTLNLHYNKLSLFQTGLFSGLPQLRTLNLSSNLLETVQVTGVFQLNSLHTLDLSGNNLTDIDYVSLISRLPRLSYLQLQDNLLPCDLEKDMDVYFEGDNFKYVLYGNKIGDLKCTDIKIKKTFKEVTDSLVKNSTAGGSRTAEIWIFVLIFIIIGSIGLLFFLQYRTYQLITRGAMAKSISRANLVATDLESADNSFLKE